jgi:hypothetical protein
MTSFAKHIAVLLVALLATTALAEKSSDPKGTPESKESGSKKSKKSKKEKGAETPGPEKKGVDVPVPPGHPVKVLSIPYYDSTGKHEMDFHIQVAARLDKNHVDMTNMQVDTYDKDGEHEMQIDLPRSVLDTDTSDLTSQMHVTIERSDFILTGESLIFNTKTKQGALGGGIHMTIYNREEKTTGSDEEAAKANNEPPKLDLAPDTFKTPASRQVGSPATENPDRFVTPGPK